MSLSVVRDGSQDVTAALQQALDAGGDVHIPEGLYRLEGHVQMRSGSRLYGAGMGRTVLLDAKTTADTGPPWGVISAHSTDNVEVRDLTIQRDLTAALPPPGHGHKAVCFTGTVDEPIENARMARVETIDMLGENLYVDGYATNVVIEGCRVRRPGRLGFTGQGINFNITSGNAQGCRVIGNLVDGEGGGLVSQALLLNGDGIVCIGNQVLDMGVQGGGDVVNFAQSHGFVFSGNVISGCDITAAAASIIRLGLNHNAPNEQTSGVVSGNTFCDNKLGAVASANVVHVQRCVGPIVISGNVFRNNAATFDTQSNPAGTPSVVYVSSDGVLDPMVAIHGNAFWLGAVDGVSNTGRAFGIRDDVGGAGLEMSHNQFSGDWPAGDRYR